MKLTLLGTGTPTPSLKRASSSYLVEIGSDKILLDHGPGSHERLLQLGRRAVDITHIAFSHLHYDHCSEFVRLFLTRWDQGAGRIPELVVLGPRDTKEMAQRLFGRQGAFAWDLTARIEHQGSIDIFVARGGVAPRLWPNPDVRELTPTQGYEGQGWRMTVAPASHVQPYLECFALRIDTPDASLCYSGDSGGVSPALSELAAGCDVLIHMNHYYSGTEPTPEYRMVCGNHRDVAQVAAKAGVRTLVLTHFLEQIDQPGVREQIIREIGEVYSGHVIWGEDLMEIPVKGPQMFRMV